LNAKRDGNLEKFRLRSFVGRLIQMDEVEIHEAPIDLACLSQAIESTPKATLFRKAGPERHEIVGGVMGGRRRLAAAFGVKPEDLAAEYQRRMSRPQPVVEIDSVHAPVHEVVLQGHDIDLTKLPFHLQHEQDGGPYISSGIDYCVDPATGKSNVGCRRLMLRSRNTLRSNLSQPSDLQRIYKACVARGERLPVSFAVGSHPADFVAAGLRQSLDEYGLVATMRGEPMAMVRGITNGVLAPADAEMIIEGYFDELGYRELEGPYGEFWGFYGPVHIDPVFHVTAVTMREDVLFQTVLHGGRQSNRNEGANMNALHLEVLASRTLRGVNIEPAAIYAVRTAASRQHIRVALNRGVHGQARFVISALFGLRGVKHVVVTDDDIDVTSDAEVEWAMSTRFRADRDLVVASGFPAYYADPTINEEGMVTKVAFDLTASYSKPDTVENRRPRPPRIENGAPKCRTVREALEDGPLYFQQIMQATGSTDGREIVLELDALREEGILDRTQNGEWRLGRLREG
jgi:UbiD family decarboxylase